MSPRPYRMGQRQAGAEQTRARIIAAARELLIASGGFARFTVDAIADQAGVARMTVYYQFGSKIGLLHAIFDDLAARGLTGRLSPAFERAEPFDALADVIAAFSHFWASDRLVIRRLRALAALDPDFEQAIRARDERRRQVLRVMIERIQGKHDRTAVSSPGDAVDILHTLTSFETFDGLAIDGRSPEDVASIAYRLALAALGFDDEGSRSERSGS